MSTTAPVQLDNDAFDLAGVSTATATPDAAQPRLGSVYDPLTLAAAAPVWFHPIHDGGHIMVSARRWTGATPVGGAPGVFSTYVEDLAPSWIIVGAGHRRPIPGQPITIPMNTPTDSPPTLVAGASRAPDYLYLLHSATINGDRAAVLQRFMVSYTGAVTLAAEEVLPTIAAGGQTIVFDKGLQFTTPYLHLYGTDSTGAVYRMRKSWHAVGANKIQYRMVPSRAIGLELYWQYFMGTGFSADAAEAVPVPGMISDGPLAFSTFLNGVLMVTTVKSGTTYAGQGWTSKGGKAFVKSGTPIDLGTGSVYLGGTVQLQPGLQANSAAAAMTANTQTGTPYVTWTKVAGGGGTSLHTAWNIWSIAP